MNWGVSLEHAKFDRLIFISLKPFNKLDVERDETSAV